jgi:hypothetical protein
MKFKAFVIAVMMVISMPLKNTFSPHSLQLYQDLSIKKKGAVYTDSNTQHARKILIDDAKKHPLGMVIFEIRYDAKNKKFNLITPLQEEKNSRVKTLLKSLNRYIAKNINSQKSFSFLVSVADSTIPSEYCFKKIDFKSVPFLLFDMRKSEYQKYMNVFYLVPDAYLVNVSVYDNMRQKVIHASEEVDFLKRPPIAGWRGAQTGGSFTIDNKENIPRWKLVWFSKLHPDMVDARFTDHKTQVPQTKNGTLYSNPYLIWL